MSPEIDGVEDASATPAEERPAWATDALDVLIGDDYSEVEDESPDGAPAADAAPEPEGDDGDTTPEPGDAPTDTEDGDEPEELKEILKGLSRTQKGKAIQHFRAQAEARHKEAQEIEDRNRADATAREAKAAEIREKRGKYIGEVEVKLADGTIVPTYKEIERLLTKADDGEEILEDKYGMSPAEAKAQLRTWDEAKALLNDSIDDFRTEAWVESGKKLAVSVAASGLPIDEIWKSVKGIDDVVPAVVAHLTAKHQAEVSALKKDTDGRVRAATANGTAQAARTAAKTLPQPETGGRGDAGGARIYTESEIADIAFYKANEADIDRAYEEGRIRPG